MALKVGLDQLSAWILATIAAGGLFGAGFLVTKLAARQPEADYREEREEAPGEKAVHGDGHASHSQEHEDATEHGGHSDGEHGSKGAHGEPSDHPAARSRTSAHTSGEHGESHGGKADHDGAHPASGHGAKGSDHKKDAGHNPEGGEPGDAKPHSEKGHGDSESSEHGEAEHPAANEDHHGGEHHGSRTKAAPAAKATAGAIDPSLWDYKGSSGPEHWADISGVTTLCDGKKQSPIDIDVPKVNAKLLPIRFTYKTSDLVMRRGARSVLITPETGNFMEVDGERFDLTEITFHAPSEHKISGAPYDLEMQMLHLSADGKLAIVAVLYEEGAENAALEPIWRLLPAQGDSDPEPFAFNPESLLPNRRIYYRYGGSLTRPPCSEGVAWYVFAKPMSISAKQVDSFVRIAPFNARPVQPLNRRLVEKSTR